MTINPVTRGITSEQIGRLLQALVLEPCHVTGMHDPNHTEHYLCQIQKSALLDRILDALDLTPADLPHRLHDACAWCHSVPGQEEFREKLRKVWDWAGVEHTPELAATAADGYFPGDEEIVLDVLTDEVQTWNQVWTTLDWPPLRGHRSMEKLVGWGLVEYVELPGRRGARRMRPYTLGERVWIHRRLPETDERGRERQETRGGAYQAVVLAAPMPTLLVQFLGDGENQVLPVSWVDRRVDQEVR